MSDYYCKHGNYVGHPYGPDYLCGLCEDGDPAEEDQEDERE